jgi:L-threonylcarbamoyladenylate synthase
MIGENLDKAAELLKAEEVVAIPTETVYGLAGNAFSQKAVATIFQVKNRPSFDPLIVHTGHWDQVGGVVRSVPTQALLLADHFMPGPLTLLLPRGENIPDIVTAGSERVAIRIPGHPLTQRLLAQLPFPVAAPSANPFGYISPTTAQHVEDQLGEKIPYILDGGPCRVGLESTIVGFDEGRAVVYRKGGTPVEAIEKVIGAVEVRTHSTSNPSAPGMLKSHYAPGARVILGKPETILPQYPDKQAGVITFSRTVAGVAKSHQLVLSSSGSFTEAAQRLFAGMRYLDTLDLDLIIAELVPEEGLGRAINDRLRRAAAE